MDKATSIAAAIDAGKLPSTQQINAFLGWINQSINSAQPSKTEDRLSDQGRILAEDVRNILDSYKTLNSNKNDDNLLQETIWHLTEGDINAAVDSEKVKMEEVVSDADTVRKSLRTILSLVWQSLFSEGNFLLDDFASFARLGLADVAEIVQDQAGRAKDSLREIDHDVEEGKRDNLGRDKERLEGEQDTRVAFENRMETLKETGSKAIGATQSSKAKAQDLSGQATERLQGAHYNAYYKACETAQKDPEYHSAISGVLDTLHKWIIRALDTPPDKPFTIDTFIADSTPEQHVPKAMDALKALLDRFANPQSSVDAVLQAAQRFVSTIRTNPEVRAWVDESFVHARKGLDDPEYPGSEEARLMRHDLNTKGRTILDSSTDAGRTWDELKETARTFGGALAADPDIDRVRQAHVKLGRDAAQGFAENAAHASLELTPWLWRDLFTVYAPRVLSILKGIPIPRTEYVDNDLELVLEDLDISTLKLDPAHISVRNVTDLDVRTSETESEVTTSVGTETHIQLQAIQVALKDVSFYYKDKQHKSMPPTPSTYTGLLGLTMPPQGINADFKIRLIKSEKERAEAHAYHRIDTVTVQIAEDVQVSVRQSNHALTLAITKPFFKKGLRRALGRALGAQLRTALESADAIAYDAGRRAQVLEDTGIGRGPALVGGMWSEVGRLIRERSTVMRATGTGVVVVRDEGGKEEARFAMGAEPQVLPGEKHGPAGTGSQSLASRVGGEGHSGDANAAQGTQGAIEGSRRQVSSFRSGVEEKSAMEKKHPGWQSSAFDV